MKKDRNIYPRGLDAKKVRGIIQYHDSQTDDQAAAEAEAAYINSTVSLVRVPNAFVADVERFVAERAGKPERKPKGAKRRVA